MPQVVFVLLQGLFVTFRPLIDATAGFVTERASRLFEWFRWIDSMNDTHS